MLDLRIAGKILHHKKKLFYNKPKWFEFIGFIEYSINSYVGSVFGFKKEKIFTKIIDLTKPQEELLSRFRKNTKYEVKRAEGEGVKFKIEDDIDAFIDFYNSFAQSKNNPEVLPALDRKYIYSLKGCLTITKAVFEDEVLTMHSYVSDRRAKRARLLNTASLFRYENDAQKKNLIGRSNRFLHYQDMLYFKNQGIEIYDMGGYAYNTQDEGLKKINEFKDGFGGELLEESNYLSLPFYALKTLRLLQKKFFKGRG